ncbi:MAG: HAD family hydrolase, partial [Bacteroidota bacterium]
VFRPHLRLIPGLDSFLQQAYLRQIPMAIGSAALPVNIQYVLDGLQINHYFNAIVSAVDVQVSKPDPETFLSAAAKLGVDPSDCIVFEDAPKGVEAASRAGMKCVVLTTMHSSDDFQRSKHILAFSKNYYEILNHNIFDMF